ncbi:hypothetical protein DDE82_002151 [Stemphylium lycopersici]|nr:hypothetical protein TW65_04664 [Stemphylium lycopersici]RAR08861.1 hypothetical protein DDE82_002151 [Stemphylium lycopersici]
MGRWADMDSVRKKHPCGLDAPPLTTKQDTERLPSGFERIGYDSDTQIYTFRDSEGNTYESEPGNRYGELRPVRSPSRHMMFAPAETTEGHNAQPSRSFADMLSGQEDAIEEQNKEATRIMLPFALLVLVFLVLVFKLLYRSDNGSVADPQDAIDCGEGSDAYSAMPVSMHPIPQTQYQHYIPRFLLRRFSTPPPAAVSHERKRSRNRRSDDILNTVRLDKDVPEIGTVLVGRVFGQLDMYRDDSLFGQEEQNRLEKKLSKIEQAASRIINTVVTAHTTGHDRVSLSRYDKDVLRKFMFVMKYRSTIFFQRFNHQKADDYCADDKAQFLEYMEKHKKKRPLDVWFDNLIKIIDKDMDPDGRWLTELLDEIYPGDAQWLSFNVRSMYLCLVTPSDPSDEFLLTGNAFGIHEGPVDYSTNCSTGAMMQAHNDPAHAVSLLRDLPVMKARNSYTVVKNKRIFLADNADGEPRKENNFTFTFFRLESRHVQTMNLVMLDQAHNSSHIVFKSEAGLRRALEFYLGYPTQANGLYSIKTISERPDLSTIKPNTSA